MIRKSVLFGVALLAFALAGPPIRAQSGIAGNLTAAGTVCTVSNACLVIAIPQSNGGATIKLSGTFSATVQFEASADPITVDANSAAWVAISATPSSSTTTATSATTTGAWQVNVTAYRRIRVRVSTYASGTVAAAINLSTASARSGSGGGGGTITGCTTSSGVAFENGTNNTLTCESQFLWDLANHAQFIGPAESTLLPEIQGWFGAYPLGSEFVNSSRVNGFGILQQGAGNALWVAAFATTNTNTVAVTGQGVSDVSSGTINELIGFDGTVAPIKAGTITNAYSFLSDSPGTTLGSTGVITNLNGFMASFGGYHGSGTVSNVYGFHSAKQGGSIHVTNSYGYYADDSGTGTNDWNYFSNGGKNKLLSGTLQVDPILTVASLPSTSTPYGAAVVIEGTGTGNVPVEGETALLEVIQESGATDGIVLWNKAAPAGNSIDLSLANDGRAFLLHSTDGSEADYILFHVDGSIEVVPASGKALISPLYSTATNCTSSASPAVCAAAPAGSVVVAAAGTSVVVNTTAVTANSQIFIQFDSSLSTKLSVTCNATVDLGQVTARSAGVSFTITSAAAPAVNPACYSYFITN